MAEGDWLRVNSTVLWLDVAEFERASRTGSGRRALRQAADLYRGELLENCYHSWCDQPRRRLERAYLDVLKALMADSAARNDRHGALAYGEQILDREPVDERTHRALMLLRFRMGDRIGALRR